MTEFINSRVSELKTLTAKYPHCIPVSAAAEILHIKPEALRASIEQNRCPFAFCWKLGDRMAYKLPTVTFCSWLLKGSV